MIEKIKLSLDREHAKLLRAALDLALNHDPNQEIREPFDAVIVDGAREIVVAYPHSTGTEEEIEEQFARNEAGGVEGLDKLADWANALADFIYQEED
jgi:hypothetical protein